MYRSMCRRPFLLLGLFDKHFIYNTRKKGPAGKNIRFFILEKLKIWILNKKFNPLMGHNQGICSVFDKGHGRPPPTPSSYALVVIRKRIIPSFAKFTIMKLKTDIFSVSMIFL